MFPQLQINLSVIEDNVRCVKGMCAEHGIEITGVTKVFRGDPEITKAYINAGLVCVGDSRTENLKRIADSGLRAERWLIRMPAPDRAEETVRYADVSLNSEEAAIRALSEACEKRGRHHGIILMYDLGDLREGYIEKEEIRHAADLVRSLPGLELRGIGTNLTCLNFVHPDTAKLQLLADVAKEIGAQGYVSGGNSATLDLMLSGGIPEGVNNLRLGESLLFGRERARYQYLPGTRNDAFILRAEIIEIKEKPSMPWGEFGVDSYGRAPEHRDRGIRRRAICALGRQDTDFETLWPLDPGVEILGASSDHLVMDVTDSDVQYEVGDILELRLGYFALMRAYTSEYVQKMFVR